MRSIKEEKSERSLYRTVKIDTSKKIKSGDEEHGRDAKMVLPGLQMSSNTK